MQKHLQITITRFFLFRINVKFSVCSGTRSLELTIHIGRSLHIKSQRKIHKLAAVINIFLPIYLFLFR